MITSFIILAIDPIWIPITIFGLGTGVGIARWFILRAVKGQDDAIKSIKDNFDNFIIRYEQDCKEAVEKIHKMELGMTEKNGQKELDHEREISRLKQEFADGFVRTVEEMGKISIKLAELKPFVLQKSHE